MSQTEKETKVKKLLEAEKLAQENIVEKPFFAANNHTKKQPAKSLITTKGSSY